MTSLTCKIELKGELNDEISYHFEWKSKCSAIDDVIVKVMENHIAQHVSEVQLHGFEKIDVTILKKLLRLSKDRFQVSLEALSHANSYKVHLYLEQPSVKESSLPKVNILSAYYIHELVPFFQNSTDVLKFEILKTMVKFFTNVPELLPPQVKEIISVIRFLDHDDVKKVFRKLFFLCNQNSEYLELLTEALSHVKRNNSEFNWNQVEKSASLPRRFLKINDCLELIALFQSHLNEADRDRSVYYLRALVILQELTRNLERFDQIPENKLHKDCNNKINEFNQTTDFSAKFLVAYSLENLKLDENARRINHLMLFLLVQENPPQGPWEFLVKRATLPIDRHDTKILERMWQGLTLIQTTYTLNRDKFLLDFHAFTSDALSKREKTASQFEAALKMSHGYYFIEGCIELIRYLIDLHAYDASMEVVINAMNLLLKIRSDNHVSQDSIYCYFRADKKLKNLQTHINDRVCAILNYCMQSPNPPVVLAAKQSFSKLRGEGMPETIPLTEFPKCQLFEQSLRSIAPHISGLRQMKMQLESDAQLEVLQEKLTAPQVFLPSGKVSCLHTTLMSYLSDPQNKAVFLFGKAEFENSIIIKQIILKHLKNFPILNIIPIFISLKELINPQKKFIEETLKKYDMLESTPLLQKKRVVWFVDDFDASFKHGAIFNFYSTNSLDRWPKAQFVFTCVNRVLKSCFNPNLKVRIIGKRNPLSVQELEMAPFIEEQLQDLSIKSDS